MDKNEIIEVLEQHRLWLNDNGGEKANLCGADLCGADLRGADLCDANLRSANLRDADLRSANLRSANLRSANLCGADLCGADLRSDNLRSANLRSANLHNVRYDHRTSFFALQCPEDGSFIGYKKASRHIVKLEILPDAKRSSATTRKCRCSAAKVLSITTLDGKDDGTQSVSSDKDSGFVYRVGEIVRVDDFDEDRWNECSTGIHFFVTRDEAVKYN